MPCATANGSGTSLEYCFTVPYRQGSVAGSPPNFGRASSERSQGRNVLKTKVAAFRIRSLAGGSPQGNRQCAAPERERLRLFAIRRGFAGCTRGWSLRLIWRHSAESFPSFFSEAVLPFPALSDCSCRRCHSTRP